MISNFLKGLKLCRSKLAIALCGLGIYCPCLADQWSENEDLVHKKNQQSQIAFLPVHLMDDEALIQSAQMRRDGIMSSETRLLNSQWLVQSKHNTWSGNKAVSKILKVGFLRFMSSHVQTQSNLMEQPLREENNSIWQNYSFELSGNKVLVGMTYQF